MGLLSRCVVVVAIAGCGEVVAPKPDATPTYMVVGNVTGFAGRSLVLQLDSGEELSITGDGAFGFTTPFTDGASYSVTVKTQPICPERRCTIANGTGTVTPSMVPIEVTCEKPKQRLVAGSWGEKSLRITDDVRSLAHMSTATPKIIMGANTQISTSDLDSTAYDSQRDIAYMATGKTGGTYGPGILVFRNASTLTGDVNYDARITVNDETEFLGLELDAAADRLYASGRKGLYVFPLASTLSGYVVPAAKLTPEDPTTANPGTIALDTLADRLYVAGEYTNHIYVYDNARAITSATTPTHTVSWDLAGAFEGPPALAIDECRDRLYVGSNDASPNGFSLFAFDNASALDGAIDPETASQARMLVPGQQAISADIDSEGSLYWWEDSATKVHIYTVPHTLMGPVTLGPEVTVNAVVQSGYGLDVVSYY